MALTPIHQPSPDTVQGSQQQALLLAELYHEINMSGTEQMQTLFEGIRHQIHRVESAHQESGRILSERVSTSESRIIVLDGQIAANEQLRQQEKLAADQKILALQDQIYNLIGIVNQLSSRLTTEESTRSAQANNLNSVHNQLSDRIAAEKNNSDTQNVAVQQALSAVNDRVTAVQGQANQINGLNSFAHAVNDRVTAAEGRASQIYHSTLQVNDYASQINNHLSAVDSRVTAAQAQADGVLTFALAVNNRVTVIENAFNGHTHDVILRGVKNTTLGPNPNS